MVKKYIIKYFILLVLSYIFVNLGIELIFYFFPDILSFETKQNTITSFSSNAFIYPLTLICNAIIVLIIRLDLKKHEIESNPLLLLTFFNSLFGIIFYLILISAKDLNSSKLHHDSTN